MNSDLLVSPTALMFAVILVVIALLINLREKIGLEKDMLIGVFRAVVQLVVVGYVLTYVIKINQYWLTLLMILIIIFNAAANARKRAHNMPYGFWISLFAISISTGVTLALLILTGVIKFIPSQMVPISGMIASNVMIAIGLAYRSMYENFNDQRQAVLEKLALGATAKQASIEIVRRAIRTSLSPTIDSAKTVGLVSLPGMMSGLIFAGVDPTKAIMYQIMVTFMLLASTSIGSVIACYLMYPQYYNKDLQLL
ncbi:ABC transporter permease [Weissella paramesenteroides]|uniref:ABC transporter permease n=1 Tax=Weissella paramesenteroides TaxID=1249 RepID=UPI002E7C1C8F|nr:iron export ABC transporter permease subunit FetB [Weissella paramesenteroides]WPQ68127.1 iron export ABC transporter permease subunit FetB [Weissella paramesenteroides]